MASKDNKDIQGTDYSHLAKPDMRTSRRNFIAAASTVASAGIFVGGRAGSETCESTGSQRWAVSRLLAIRGLAEQV
jgi:hypothetical protein